MAKAYYIVREDILGVYDNGRTELIQKSTIAIIREDEPLYDELYRYVNKDESRSMRGIWSSQLKYLLANFMNKIQKRPADEYSILIEYLDKLNPLKEDTPISDQFLTIEEEEYAI